MEGLPFVTGPVEIHVGNEVKLGGNISVMSGRTFDTPKLILKDRASVGWSNTFSVNKEIVIEENVLIAPGCRISDSDGHPREADLRATGIPAHPEDVKPVRICKDAWIAAGVHILKGVTIGEGAIIAANSVVITNIPPYSLAMGNPAEVLFRNFGKPSTARQKTKPATSQAPD